MTKLMVGLMLACALVVGCEKGGEGGAKADASGKSGSAASGEAIGVPECDEYFKKWDDCSGKSPAVKAVMADSVKQNRDAWTLMAATPQGKENLKQICKSASASLADSCK